MFQNHFIHLDSILISSTYKSSKKIALEINDY